MLTIRPVDEGGLPSAAELLTKGFPQRGLAFWQKGLARLNAYCREQDFRSFGSFLVSKGKPVGVLLEIPSFDAVTGEKVVNLSSWYVEEKFRWFAPKMLMQAISDENVTYTDFTPTPEMVEFNGRLGFRTIASRQMFFALPLAAVGWGSPARVLSFDKLPASALSRRERQVIRTHVDLGCTALVVQARDAHHPIVLDVIRRKNIPVARILYVENRRVIVDNIRPIARALLTRGVPVLSVLAPSDIHCRYAIRGRSTHHYQIKGTWRDEAINELFSERVFLNV